MTEYNEYKDIPEEKENDAQYFCKFTFGQFFTVLVLEVVTFAFIFYLGAKYGTDYLKVSEEDRAKPTEVISVNNPPSVVTSPQIQDAELQAMAKEVVKPVDKDAELKERVKELLAKQTETAKAASAPVAPDQTVQAQQIAPAPKPPAPVESSVPVLMKSSSQNPYSIQVGSYPNMDEANGKVSDWRSKGYPSFMMIADIPDRGRWYRVRIGGFASKDDAQKYLEKIRQNDGTEGIVVLNEQ